jgi:hypothetical protein
MKIAEIIKKLDKSEQNKGFPKWDKFSNLFDFYFEPNYEKFENELASYFFAKWYCTDTWVGGRVYFLNNEPVAISSQLGRKSEEKIQFLSMEALYKVKDFMMKCCAEDNDYSTLLVDMDEDYGEGYKISYGSQLLRRDCIHVPSGKRVTIIETFESINQVDKWKIVIIRFNDSNETKTVSLEDLIFSFGR